MRLSNFGLLSACFCAGMATASTKYWLKFFLCLMAISALIAILDKIDEGVDRVVKSMDQKGG